MYSILLLKTVIRCKVDLGIYTADLPYLQSRQEGGNSAKPHIELVRALLGAKPNKANSPREGAATVIGQSVLEYVLGLK